MQNGLALQVNMLSKSAPFRRLSGGQARINRDGFHDKVFKIPDSFAAKSLDWAKQAPLGALVAQGQEGLRDNTHAGGVALPPEPPCARHRAQVGSRVYIHWVPATEHPIARVRWGPFAG
jgi:hypothetical protein